MSVAKVTEISATSSEGVEDAIRRGVARANQTLENVTGAWVSEIKADVEDGQVTQFRINMKVTFILKD